MKVGQPIILFRTSNSDPAEDFTIAYQGQVSDFATAGLMSNALALHYGGGCEHVVYTGTPLVAPAPITSRTTTRLRSSTRPTAWTAACASAYRPRPSRTAASRSSRVASSSKTTWVVDIANSIGRTFFNTYVPLINGSDTNFSHPYVLTYPVNAYPTDMPRPQLMTQTLQQFSNGGFVNRRHRQCQPGVGRRLRSALLGNSLPEP